MALVITLAILMALIGLAGTIFIHYLGSEQEIAIAVNDNLGL